MPAFQTRSVTISASNIPQKFSTILLPFQPGIFLPGMKLERPNVTTENEG
jgi:hypothetical protein